jgi:hypothetical protein
MFTMGWLSQMKCIIVLKRLIAEFERRLKDKEWQKATFWTAFKFFLQTKKSVIYYGKTFKQRQFR